MMQASTERNSYHHLFEQINKQQQKEIPGIKTPIFDLTKGS
jgi:hypothetical protein